MTTQAVIVSVVTPALLAGLGWAIVALNAWSARKPLSRP